MAQEAAVQSVVRALQILGAFGDGRRELGVTQLARFLDVHASTASRLAATLASQGFLERGAGGGGFRLGPEMIRLGLLAAGGGSLVETARESMDELAAETGETVVLSLPSRSETIEIAQVDTRYLVGGKSWVGRRLPLHATSDGKVFLAFGAATLKARGPLEPVTPGTITDRAELARRITEIRAQGWAPSVGELEEGLNGVAAPIFSDGERCVAALSVSGPSYRVGVDALPALGERCREAAEAISTRLGPTAVAAMTTTNGGSP
jgi:DNA-binding IclR family transcriptional regulator